MEKTYWKYLKLLVASCVLVVVFLLLFSYLYNKVRVKPYYEIQDYKVEVKIQRLDGTFAKLDSCQYKIYPTPKIIETPIDANDYSSFLVSFISVLATFVVIANFANVKDLISASENAEKAKEEAEKAKEEAEKAKSDTESAIVQLSDKIKEVDNTLAAVKIVQTNVEEIKKEAVDSLQKSTQLVTELNESISGKFSELNQQIIDAQGSFDSFKSDIKIKQDDLVRIYENVLAQANKSKDELASQRADLDAATSRLIEVENKMNSVFAPNKLDNELKTSVLQDPSSSNQGSPIKVNVNNNN